MRPFAPLVLLAVFSLPTAAVAARPTLGVQNTGNGTPAGPPVQIESCNAATRGGPLVAETGGSYRIAFTNEGRVPADMVEFHLTLRDQSLNIRDVGKFEPGVTVTHVFKRRGGAIYTSPLFGGSAKFTCSVAAIHFTDGTEWTPGAAAANAARGNAPIKYMGNGYIGVQFAQNGEDVVVRLVLPASPAREGGLKQGDVVDAIDEEHVATVPDAIMLISATPPGTSLKITVRRNGDFLPLSVVVGARVKGTP